MKLMATLLVAACIAAPALAQEHALARAAKAMGADAVRTLRYAGDGVGYAFGQAYRPGMAWPRFRIQSVTRTIDYDTGSMHQEIAFTRNEPLGGGGYPHVGQARNSEYVSGAFAWNQAAAGPTPGPRWNAERTHQLWITPHGIIKAAQRNKAKVRTNGKGAVLSFTEPGRFTAIAFVDAQGLVERVESTTTDPVLGETRAVTTYSDYRDHGGVKFPGRIRQSQGGHPVLDITIRDVQPNAAAAIQVPDVVRNFSERVTTDQVADGVWFIGGGSHNSVLIEMNDHVVLVEAPLNDGRMIPVLAEVKKLAAGKPIRYVVNSHSHFDHSGGLRTVVAEGATVVTHAQNQAYFQRAFTTPSRIAPDRLTQSGKKPSFLTVGKKHTLTDGTRRIDLYDIEDSPHTTTFLIVHLPKERLLIEADAFTPPPPNTAPPATPNPHHVNLIENLDRLKLDVERILPLHGRVVPLSDLYTAAGVKR